MSLGCTAADSEVFGCSVESWRLTNLDGIDVTRMNMICGPEYLSLLVETCKPTTEKISRAMKVNPSHREQFGDNSHRKSFHWQFARGLASFRRRQCKEKCQD